MRKFEKIMKKKVLVTEKKNSAPNWTLVSVAHTTREVSHVISMEKYFLCLLNSDHATIHTQTLKVRLYDF